MIRLQLVDPESLPERIPGIALQAPGGVLFVLKSNLTADEIEYWITRLGADICRETADATLTRSQAAAKPPVRLRKVPRRLSGARA